MGENVHLCVGRSDSLERTVTAADVDAFAQATGDSNPIHLDDAFAARTRFGRRIAHGMLAASYVSSLLGTRLPGPGSIYLSQTLKFTKPVYLGDTLTVTATVAGYRPERGIVTLETAVSNQRGETVLSGEAVCLVGDAAVAPRVARSGAAAG
jgi:3-hydroxybutyryl-CoA dehydratase